MKFSEMYPSKFLKCEDLQGKRVALTIMSLMLEEIGQDREEKPVLRFKKTDKALVLNKTNARMLSDLFGDDSDGWVGQTVVLAPARVSFQGKIVDSIRIEQAPGSAPAPAPVPLGAEDDIPF